MSNDQKQMVKARRRSRFLSDGDTFSCVSMPARIRYRYVVLFYLASFFLYAFGAWLSSTTYESFLGIDWLWAKRGFYLAALLFLVAQALFQDYTIRRIVVFCVVFGLLFVSARVSKSNMLIWMFVYVFFARDIPFRKLLTIHMVILVVVGVITIGGFALGLTPEFVLDDNTSRGVRHSLGFGHPNMLATWLLCLVLTWAARRGRRIGPFDLLMVIVVGIISNELTDSRTALFAFALVGIGEILWMLGRWLGWKWTMRKIGLINTACGIAVAMCAIASIGMMVAYDPSIPWMGEVNKLLSERPKLAHYYYAEYGLTWLGRSYADVAAVSVGARGANVTFLVDNLYARLILQHGVVVAGLLIVVLVVAVANPGRRREFVLPSLGLTMYGIIGLMEPTCIQIEIDVFILPAMAIVVGVVSGNSSYLNRERGRRCIS